MNFGERYDREGFRKFLQTSFLPEDYKPEETELQFPIKTEYSTRAVKLGHSRSLDLDVYEIHHTSSHDARVTISREAFRLLFEENRDFALALFVPEEDPAHYRFSLIEMQISIDGAGLRRTYSNPRRYSYLLGEGIACHTPDEYLLGKGRVQSKEDLRERFSVEVLTRQFYNELFAWYEWALEPESGVTFPNLVTTPDDDRDNLKVKLIRLLTRLIFVWFIKQKELVPGELFDEAALGRVLKDFDPVSKTSGSYYNAVLQNLFFATLNRAITDDHGGHRGFAERRGKPDLKTLYRYAELFSISEAEVVELFSKVPFLNGGLFECLDKTVKLDGVESAYYYDGFSRNDAKFKNGSYRHRAFVPNVLFFEEDRGLLPIFKRYNFTIEENSPSDVQVALDPELLGKVFENLLGVYNEETEETARKQSGSFYTPREIVDYMACESLKAYFRAACPGLAEGELQKLFEDSPELSLSQGDREALIRAIYNCKILDPACGSGAFPMGILQRLCHALRLLDPGNESWERLIVQAAKAKLAEALDKADDRERNAKIQSVSDTFGRQKAHPDYTRKLYLIENCIHGVDIQPIAIQISKLRFFISLICEQEPSKDASENYGVLPLPNLETNLVCANALLAKQAGGQPTFTDPDVEKLKGELLDIRDAHFNASSAAKKEALRHKDEATRKKLARALAESGFYTRSDAEQLAQWDPYDQNESASFFDPEWMFGIGEFDLVLGNPPYISAPTQMKSKVLTEQRKAIAESRDYETLHQKWDLYIPFMEKGLKLLSAGGSFAMIVPFPLSNQLYALKFRRWVLSHYDVTEIADLNGTKVFENATVSNLILFATNRKGKGETTISHIDGEGKIRRAFVQPYSRLVQDSKNSVWNFTQQERHTARHEDMNVLGDFCYISVGMVLNADEKSAKGEFKKEDLISEVKDSLHPREYIEAKDIGRYSVRRVRYLEYGTPRCPGKLRRPTFKELYEHDKLIFNRLGQLQVMLDDKMHCLQSDSSFVAVLWHDLHGVENKSITSSIKKFSRLSRQQMEELSHTVSLEYLLGVMNSRQASHLLSTLRGGDYHIVPEHIRNIPIPRATPDEQRPIVELVRQVLAAKAKGEDTTTLERQIDRLVCDLYGLSAEERAAIGVS